MSRLDLARSLWRLQRGSRRATHSFYSHRPTIPQSLSCRAFSTSLVNQSRIGGAPILVPPDVSLRFFDLPKNARVRNRGVPVSAVEVTGPLGQMTLPLPSFLTATHDVENKRVSFEVSDTETRHFRAMWGTMRAHMNNYIFGVSEGHSCVLKLVGVGYRATIEDAATSKKPQYPGQKFVVLKLGFAHLIEMPIPQGVKASVPLPTRILLEACDKQAVTQFAAEIREWRKPEPYKGKGIFVNNETIKLKAKKIK